MPTRPPHLFSEKKSAWEVLAEEKRLANRMSDDMGSTEWTAATNFKETNIQSSEMRYKKCISSAKSCLFNPQVDQYYIEKFGTPENKDPKEVRPSETGSPKQTMTTKLNMRILWTKMANKFHLFPRARKRLTWFLTLNGLLLYSYVEWTFEANFSRKILKRETQ